MSILLVSGNVDTEVHITDVSKQIEHTVDDILDDLPNLIASS